MIWPWTSSTCTSAHRGWRFTSTPPDGYTRVRQRGEQDLPRTVAVDDLALVKLRAHDSQVDLHEAPVAWAGTATPFLCGRAVI